MATGSVSPKRGKVVDIPANAPTIGTATDAVTGGTVSVPFTAGSTEIGGPVFSYRAVSNPGSITGTSTSSPITVSGLTNDTAYTFTVAAVNPTGTGPFSAASNSVTPTIPPTSFESIASATVGTGGIITFSSIPSTYKHLQLRFITKSTYSTAHLGWGNSMVLVINGSSTTSYSHFLYGNGTSVTGASGSGDNYINIYGTNASSASGMANMFSAGIVDIHDYTSTTKLKTFTTFAGLEINSAASQAGPALNSGFISSTAAISNITVYSAFDNFASGSVFSLYGIKG